MHEALLTAKHSGKVAYGAEAFEPIAATGQAGLVVAVAEDAPYQDLTDLLQEARRQPDSVVFSANLGAASHFAGLLLEKNAPGARFRYTQTGGGAKRFAALVGGHIDVSAFSIGEYLQFSAVGLRALAFFGEERHPSAPHVPTAIEQGVDMTFSSMHVWWAPKGVSHEKIAKLADVLKQAMQSPETREALAAIHTDPLFVDGPELHDEIARRDRKMAEVAQRPETPLPNFPAWIFLATLLLGGTAAVSAWETRAAGALHLGADRPHNGLAIQAMALSVIYVVTLQSGWLGFRISTAGFILAMAYLLSRRELTNSPAPVLLVLAAVMSVGLHYLFTQVFVIDLP